MSELPDGREEIVGQWVEKAEHDYLAAIGLLAGEEQECPFDMVCFHAQQCVEKYLKAVGVSSKRAASSRNTAQAFGVSALQW